MAIVLLIIGLIVLTVLAVRGVPIIVASLVVGLFILLTAGMSLVEGISGSYMTAFSNYVKNYYMLFILGAIFGKLCEISGACESIARTVVAKAGEKNVALGIMIAAAILGFGGVNLFVALFALYPLAMSMFRRADIPRRMFPGIYIAGIGTFAMTAPFTPSTQNIIPMAYLGTDLSAGMIPGLVGAVFCLICDFAYIQWKVKRVKAKGEHFEAIPGEDKEYTESADIPNFIIALLPLILLIVLLNAFDLPVIAALFFGIIIAFIIYFKWLPHNFSEIWKHVSAGSMNGITSLINTAAIVGFGGIVQAAPAFVTVAALIKDGAQNGNAFMTCAFAVAALAGISGSASGGLGLAVPVVADIFIPLGVNAGAIHRIAVVASSALDSLPHNGFVNTCLIYSKCTHKSSYFDIFVVSILVTIAETFIVVAMFSAM